MHTRIQTWFFMSLLVLSGSASAHTLFVKPHVFVVEPQATVDVSLINGTFLKSENRVTKSMSRSVDTIGPGDEQYDLADADWVSVDKASVLSTQFNGPGNYVIGISTKPRKVSLDPDRFNHYLKYEGLLDQKDEREQLEETGIAVVERYTKFAKAIVQVGDEQSSNYASELGYDVEIVPVTNPYSTQVGDVFRARILRDGAPVKNMRVYATHEGYYPQDDEGIYDEAVKVRSDSDGIVEFQVTDPGKWYVRFIDLQRLSDAEYWYSGLLSAVGAQEKQIVYESKWATLTFEIQ